MANMSYVPDPRETGPVRDSTGDMSASAAAAAGEAAPMDGEDDAPPLDPAAAEFEKVAMKIARQAESAHKTAFSRRSGGWQRAYRAYRGEHFAGSKYLTKEFESRSKLFVPKTRSMIRKDQTAYAAALFSTDEVVAIQPELDDDPRQSASAKVIHAILNYRLDRTSPRGGMPWFIIAMAAHQDAELTGIVCSKQDWEYEEKVIGEEPVMAPLIDEMTGQPIPDPFGEPIMMPTGEMQPVTKKVKDRPMIFLVPPENVIVDEAAPFYEPAQGAGYLILRFPTALGDVKRMMKGSNPKSLVRWRPNITDTDLQKAANAYDAAGIRRARDGGDDRMEQRANAVSDFAVCWLHENFVRYDGQDWHFWSVGTQLILSDPAPVEDIYPAFDGARPVTLGFGAIESHNIRPMSKAESVQPLQQEINDLRNLRLDAAKQAVLPFASVRKGKGIDVSTLTKLAPGKHIHVNEHDDVTFREIPSGAMGAMAESSHLNVEFDELGGQFSGSSVQTTREMNETVGGMRLLSGNANATTEFDIRVIVETWTETTLRQVVKLIQFYENDETVLRVAAQKAELFDRYGIDAVTDDMLTTEVSVKLNVGIGAVDPMQKIAKLATGMDMIGKILPVAEPKPVPNSEEIIPEIMGAVGYKDGKRFFHWPDPNAEEEPETPPEVLIEQAKQEGEDRRQQAEIEGELEEERIKAESARTVATIRERGADERERLKAKARLAERIIANRQQQRHATEEGRRGRMHELFRGAIERQSQPPA